MLRRIIMLEIHKGKSTKSYENDFFRLMAASLTDEFDKRGWTGLLMGMPKSLVLENLQIDCFLVTDNRIILIDFKNYNGVLVLPDEKLFDYKCWMMNENTVVRGGSSINPYKQLGRQRAKFIELIDKKIEKFDRNTVFTMVCFHGQVKIIGEVPRQIVSFSIADSRTVLNKIVDIIDVETTDHGYMSSANKILFADKLFFAPKYQLSVTLEDVTGCQKEDLNRASNNFPHDLQRKDFPMIDEQSKYDTDLEKFMKSEDKILIIFGNTMSGKTRLISRIREIGFKLDYLEVKVFVYSNRFKNRMQKNFPDIEEVESLYAEIFNFEDEDIDENHKKIIPKKEVDDHQEKELFIVDDSHLISNLRFDSETLQFGTGYLLDDFFSYIQFSKYSDRKIIFIGDVNRMSYGSGIENVMNEDYLISYLNNKGISTKIRKLLLSPQTDASEIVKVCNKIAECINNERYNELIITNNNEIDIDETKQTAILEAAYKDPNNNKILVYTNEQANQINLFIKKQIAQNGSSIGVGDIIVFNSTIKAHPLKRINEDVSFNYDWPKRIDNGSFAKVISVDSESTITESVIIKGQTINLTFIPCEIECTDQSILQIYVFDNYLRANKTELGTLENIAYQMYLSKLLQNFISKSQFENSYEFQKMEKKNSECYNNKQDGYYILNEKREYRLKKDSHSLPQEVKEFRERIRNELLADSSSDYNKIYYAARVKYAWAMTVNKAMAYSFKNVYFNTSQGENRGRANKDYFKWLYTGFTIAENNIELLNWMSISPFIETEFNSVSSSSVSKIKNNIFIFSNDDTLKEVQFESFIKKALAQTDWRLVDISSRSYLEIVKLQKGEIFLELSFDYNDKGEVKTPRLKAGRKEDLEEVTAMFKSFSKNNAQIKKVEIYNNMEDYFNKLIDFLKNRNIKTTVKSSQEWSVCLEFTKGKEIVEVQCWYNSHGMISKFNRIEGSNELFDEIVLSIKEKYSL